MPRNQLTSVRVSVAPSVEPVTLADLTDAGENFLRVDHATDDTLITNLIVTAREWVESYLNRALITQTRIAYYRRWYEEIHLPYSPIQSVTTVEEINEENSSTTLTANSDYYLLGDQDEWLRMASSSFLPAGHSVREVFNNHLKVTYVCGYGSAASDVPGPIKEAIKRLVGYMYENREDVVVGTIVAKMPFNIKSLLKPYRQRGVLI